MILRIILLLLILPLSVSGQSGLPVGEGMLVVAVERKPELLFYTDTTGRSINLNIRVVTNKSGEYAIRNGSRLTRTLVPEQLALEYGIFVLRVDSVAGRWCRVFINNKTQQSLWMRTDAAARFIPWKKFLLDEVTVVTKETEALDIKTAPDSAGKSIRLMESGDCFEVLDVKGDWMKVRTSTELDCSESSRPLKAGWIRWRKNNRLTISYGLTC